MRSPVRVLLVGVGTRGKHWARIMHDEPLCETVGYMDLDPAALAAIQEIYPAPAVFTDLDAALASVDADLAVLATPPMGHLEQAAKIYGSGRHLLAEKPLTLDLAESVEIVRLADAAGLTLTVGLNFRYLEVTMAAKKLFASGEIGAPSFAEFHYWTNRDGRRPGINKYPLTMHQPMLYEQSIHHLDLFRFTYGQEVARVSAVTHNPPWSMYAHDATVVALLELSGGVLVNYMGTWSGQSKLRRFFWRTDCPNGVVYQRELFSDLTVVRPGSDQFQPNDLPSQENFVDDTRGLLRHVLEQLIAGERELVPSGRDHLKTLALTVACEESSREHTVIHMADFYARHGIPKEWL